MTGAPQLCDACRTVAAPCTDRRGELSCAERRLIFDAGLLTGLAETIRGAVRGVATSSYEMGRASAELSEATGQMDRLRSAMDRLQQAADRLTEATGVLDRALGRSLGGASEVMR